MLTLEEILDGGAGMYNCAMPLAILNAAAAQIDIAWDEVESDLDKAAETEGGEPKDFQYKMGIIAGMLCIADAAEALIPLDDDWSRDPDAVNIVTAYEEMVDFFTQEGTTWGAWKENRDNTYARALKEQLKSLDTEEESRDNEND